MKIYNVYRESRKGEPSRWWIVLSTHLKSEMVKEMSYYLKQGVAVKVEYKKVK